MNHPAISLAGLSQYQKARLPLTIATLGVTYHEKLAARSAVNAARVYPTPPKDGWHAELRRLLADIEHAHIPYDTAEDAEEDDVKVILKGAGELDELAALCDEAAAIARELASTRRDSVRED